MWIAALCMELGAERGAPPPTRLQMTPGSRSGAPCDEGRYCLTSSCTTRPPIVSQSPTTSTFFPTCPAVWSWRFRHVTLLVCFRLFSSQQLVICMYPREVSGQKVLGYVGPATRTSSRL